MGVVFWPTDLISPAGFSLFKRPASVKGNPAISGITQRAASDAGRWGMRMTGIHVKDDATVRLWRAIEGLAEGQVGQIVLGIEDLSRVPGPAGYASAVSYTGNFLDFDVTAGLTKNQQAAVGADAALGATRLTIATAVGNNPSYGNIFSAGYHLYQVTRVLSTSGGTVVCDIWPPLRKAIASSDVLDFTRPKLLCRLADDDQMRAPDLDYGLWGAANLEFIEDTSEPLDGPELVTDGDFATDTIWSKGSDWSISGGKGVRVAGASASSISQAVYLYSGCSYSLTFTVSGRTAGSVTPRLTGGATVTGTLRNADGTYTETLTAGASSNTVEFNASAGAALSIDDVSLRRVY